MKRKTDLNDKQTRELDAFMTRVAVCAFAITALGYWFLDLNPFVVFFLAFGLPILVSDKFAPDSKPEA